MSGNRKRGGEAAHQSITDIQDKILRLTEELYQKVKCKTLEAEISRWEDESMKEIQRMATAARRDLERFTEELARPLTNSIQRLSSEVKDNQSIITDKELKLGSWMEQCNDIQTRINELPKYQLIKKKPTIEAIEIRTSVSTDKTSTDVPIYNGNQPQEQRHEKHGNNGASSQDSVTADKPASIVSSPSAVSSKYPTMVFGLEPSTYKDIDRLFNLLMILSPMDKKGPMSGNCNVETTQMEQFLKDQFGFKNSPDEYIVSGVKSFRLARPPHQLPSNTPIHFPTTSKSSFKMTVAEILDWQSSYTVYADGRIPGMDKEFLRRALRGQSSDGEEAFRMKFVVRISTCPILMEFNARVIARELNDEWPRRIKLVSVTGIDFAGRKHDVHDILNYISNWKEVFEVDLKTNLPLLANSRDFQVKRNGKRGELHQDILIRDLICMARLRLHACEEQGVQIVVETGIGLGVFGGERIGIDRTVQVTSAVAIKTVLEEDGPSYKNIRAIVFALPIFGQQRPDSESPNCFSTFVEEFSQPQYKGPIPVLIADQDMHRLTVAVARQGFCVSQLNPADSHGVFGEYWQNRGPAVEEKLALTTLGLLVQHHLINKEVLNPTNYHIV